MRKLAVFFSAGALGGLINSLMVWGFGIEKITRHFGVMIAPHLSPAWLYPRIVWGGIWGFVFILPFYASKPFRKGLILSLFPTLVQLLVVFPFQAHKGYLGLELGMLTPVFVLLFNAAWGITAAFVIRYAR